MKKYTLADLTVVLTPEELHELQFKREKFRKRVEHCEISFVQSLQKSAPGQKVILSCPVRDSEYLEQYTEKEIREVAKRLRDKGYKVRVREVYLLIYKSPHRHIQPNIEKFDGWKFYIHIPPH